MANSYDTRDKRRQGKVFLKDTIEKLEKWGFTYEEIGRLFLTAVARQPSSTGYLEAFSKDLNPGTNRELKKDFIIGIRAYFGEVKLKYVQTRDKKEVMRKFAGYNPSINHRPGFTIQGTLDDILQYHQITDAYHTIGERVKIGAEDYSSRVPFKKQSNAPYYLEYERILIALKGE